MSDLQRYIDKRSALDPEFAKDFEEGYQDFKIGVLLRHAREAAGLTQEEEEAKRTNPVLCRNFFPHQALEAKCNHNISPQ